LNQIASLRAPAVPRLESGAKSGKISTTMRAVLTTSFLLVSIVAIFGCGSSSKKAEAEAAQAQAAQKAAMDLHTEFKKRCGDPVRFPVSEECVRLADDQGSSLKRQSDLAVAMWRACALIPSSAETIRQELVAKGSARSAVGQKMIGEMERTEQHSDSPCVVADLRDLDCVAGNSEACEAARNADPACTAWLNDNDTQARLHCIDRAVHDPACMAKPPEEGAANYFSDSPAQAEDCRRIEKACLHTFDECANAKDALELFLKPQKTATSRPAQ
jgi:hypothetical protein